MIFAGMLAMKAPARIN